MTEPVDEPRVRAYVYVGLDDPSMARFSAAHVAAAKQVLRRLEVNHGRCESLPDFPNGGAFTVSDAKELLALLGWLKKNVPEFNLVAYGLWTTQTLRRARWVPFQGAGEPVDFTSAAADSLPLNRLPPGDCNVCGSPDEGLPQPYVVRLAARRADGEIFSAENGVVIVRQRVRALLESLVGEQVEFAPVAFASRKGDRPQIADGIFALRPLHVVPASPIHQVTRCDSCRRVIDYRCATDIHVPMLARFGSSKHAIARTESWLVRAANQPAYLWSDVVIAGELFARLYNHGVRGLVWPKEGGYLSAANESPLATRPLLPEQDDALPDRFMRKKWRLE